MISKIPIEYKPRPTKTVGRGFISDKYTSIDVLFYIAKNTAAEVFSLSKGDKIVVTGGDITGKSGNTNLIKVEELTK